MYKISSSLWLCCCCFSWLFSWFIKEVSSEDAWYDSYCNKKPLEQHILSPLYSEDQLRIAHLKQIQIFTRHGSRITENSISSYFPNSKLIEGFECDVTTIESRHYSNIGIRKHYVPNENVVEGNCAVGQSVDDLILQQRSNAELVKAAYLNGSVKLFTEKTMAELRQSIIIGNGQWQNLLQIRSTDMERTLASAVMFMGQWLNLPQPGILDVLTHDLLTDPYLAMVNNIHCPNLRLWIGEKNIQTKAFRDTWYSAFANETKELWYAATGSELRSTAGIDLLAMYCYGLPIPISLDLYERVLNVTYQFIASIYHNNETSVMISQLVAAPMVHLIQNYIQQMLILQTPKFIFHTFHDVTVLSLLESLQMSDGVQPIFGEMLSLEIYNRSDGSHVFRWLRNGKWLAFPDCNYAQTGTQLCDLDILLAAMKKFSMDMITWGPYCRNITSTATTTITKSTTSAESSNHNNGNRTDAIVIGILIGICLAILGGAVIWWIMTRNRRQYMVIDDKNDA